MTTEDLIAGILSYVALGCMTFMLLPQVYLHVKQKSTRGLSSIMLGAFLLASLMSGTYDYSIHQPSAITAAWAGFSLFAIVCLSQVTYYDPTNMKIQSLKQRRIRFLLSICLSSFVCCLVCVGVYFLLIVAEASTLPIMNEMIGYVIPIILNVAAYCVQFRLIIRSKDASGLSLGFMAFDTSAGCVSIAAIALDDWNGAAACPYFVIIICQFIMATLYFVVYPRHQALKTESTKQSEPMKLSQIEMVDASDIHSVITDSPDSRSDIESDFALDSDESDFDLNSDEEVEVHVEMVRLNELERHRLFDQQAIGENSHADYAINQTDRERLFNHAFDRSYHHSHWISIPVAVQPVC